MPYHTPTYKVLEELSVDPNVGVCPDEIEDRRRQFGANVFETQQKSSITQLFFEQIKDPMIIILLCAASVSLLLQEVIDSCIIVLVIVLNALIGVVQQYRSEQALEALKQLSSPKAQVLRGGEYQLIDAKDLVVGDIVFLQAGNIVPADLRLLETISLRCEESMLTGESDLVEKDATLLYKDHQDTAEQHNMAFMSTTVASGHGSGIVVRCGRHSEVGKIASLLKDENSEKTPLQLRLARLSKLLGAGSVAVCALMFLIGVVQQRDLFEMLLVSISLAVAAIPEGLPAVVTIVLAFGVTAMSKKNAIVRHLHAVETLGSVNVICTDKTGTLTENRMRVSDVFGSLQQGETNELLLEGAILCNHAHLGAEEVGEPMELALLRFARDRGIDIEKMRKESPLLHEKPFDSTRKRMSSVHQTTHGTVMHMKGAIEQVLPRCDQVFLNGRVQPLSSSHREAIKQECRRLAADAKRILAFACRRENGSFLEEHLVFTGLIAFIDPPRKDVKESIAAAKQAGIAVVMITGDHPDTALAIARDLEIAQTKEQVMSGSQIDQMSSKDLARQIKAIRVFARVTPTHKVKIVECFKRSGAIVSMSGDGVNDAPSLKRADIGIAMGKNGSDVCRQASDMILTDDRFATIVDAISEGRHLYMNIQKAVLYLLSCNLGEIMTLFMAIALLPGIPSPLAAVQILWVNLITDAFPALALGVDPKEQDVMKHMPRPKKEGLFAHGMGLFTLLNGMYIGTVTLVAFRFGLQYDIVHAQTMAFMVLSMSQLFHALNLRSLSHSIFQAGVLKNRWLVLTFLFGISLQILVCELPFAQLILHTASLDLVSWAVVFGLSASIIVINECSKLFHSAA